MIELSIEEIEEIKPTYGCIYVYRNKINGKCYVGKTIKPEKRYKAHINSANVGDETHFHRALRKYGIENFDYKIIWGQLMPYQYVKDNLDYWERYYIQFFDSYNNGYNMTSGGEGGNGHSNKGKPSPMKGKKTGKPSWMTGKHWNDESKQIISEATKNGMNNIETKSKCSLGGKLTGRKIWVQNGIETRRCLPEDLDFYISIGYKRGRKIS